MTTDPALLEARELVRKCAEENAQLKQEIRLAGGHLQSDGRYGWEYFSGSSGTRAEIMPVALWISRRRQAAAFMHDLFRGSRSSLSDRPTPAADRTLSG